MKKRLAIPFTQSAVFALADIKAASEAFDRGDVNVFEALDEILAAVAAYQAARRASKAVEPRRDAA